VQLPVLRCACSGDVPTVNLYLMKMISVVCRLEIVEVGNNAIKKMKYVNPLFIVA